VSNKKVACYRRFLSLFIGNLAYGKIGGVYPALVRMGVIVASLLSNSKMAAP